MTLHKNDICLVDFNPARGGEMGKLRPAVIISKDEDNEALDTVIVIPLSTLIEENTLPYRYKITKRENLKSDSDACIYEIRALSKIRVKEKIASITTEEFERIKKALCEVVS